MLADAMYHTRVGVIAFICLMIAISTSWAEDKLWSEERIGQVTGGWDLQQRRTQVTEVFLQVRGPSNIPDAAAAAIKACAARGLHAGYQTFDETPGEVGTRLAAASGVFTTSFLGCASVANIAVAVANKFYVGLGRRSHWENGTFAKGQIDNPNADLVEKYLIQNAPPGSRAFLRATNQVLNPPASFSAGSTDVPIPYPVPQTPPAIKVYQGAAGAVQSVLPGQGGGGPFAIIVPVEAPPLTAAEIKAQLARVQRAQRKCARHVKVNYVCSSPAEFQLAIQDL
jgi:hypothetical protein